MCVCVLNLLQRLLSFCFVLGYIGFFVAGKTAFNVINQFVGDVIMIFKSGLWLCGPSFPPESINLLCVYFNA